MPFTPLRVRSHGSLLAGVASPEALAERAAELGYGALALTDRDNLYLAVRFLTACGATGLKALPGAEITARDAAPGEPVPRVLLLPFDRRGWATLCALITARQLDPGFDLPRALGESHAGLHVIAETATLAAALLAAGVPPAQRGAEAVHRPLDRRGGLWLGVRGIAAERAGLRERLAAAWRLGVPAVATGDVCLLMPGDHEAHRVAVTAAAGERLERMPPAAFASREAWLAAPEEWTRRIRALCAGAGCAEAAEPLLAENEALVSRSRFELELGTPIFPHAPLPAGVTPAAELRRRAEAGLARRFPASRALSVRGAARARLESELALIDHMGFTDYFLLVAAIVGFARERGIATVGRGSGASSIVAYALGVTNVDPIRYELCFERFLHPQRRDCPDLDIDLCWRRRDEVIAFVYEAYGHDRVAMISTHSTLGARSAFRETAKVLGLPLPRVNSLARRLPRDLAPSALEDALSGRTPHALGGEFAEPRVREALRLAARLAGAPRHLSVHCGGLVIADRALTHYLPLEGSAKGVVVSQFEMRAVEAIGLVKMDLLGNRALSTIGECLTLASHDADAAAAGRDGRGTPVPSPDEIAEDDAVTAAAVARGDTLNTFQLESPAMRNLLRMLRASTLDETVAAVALVRPGPAESGMKEAFCRRHRGLEPDRFAHERLRAPLAGTHGLLLYEEDCMRVAHALCGMPLAEGETLRRAIGKAKDDGERAFLERGFLVQARGAGVDEASARAVWRDLLRFAAYAFCKAHAAGYGALGWQSAYYRARFPAAWAVGVLHHHAGMYSTWVHVEDLRRGDRDRAPVTFHAPCIARSQWASTLEGAAVRVGLHRVAGLAEATGERLVASRAERAFASLADLADRVRPTPPELEALILAGALDALPGAPSRASLLLEARVHAALATSAGARGRRSPAHGAPALAGGDGAPLAPAAIAPRPGGEALPQLPELPLAERVRGEFRATGLWFSGHPLEVLAPPLARSGAMPAREAERHAGRRVAVCGLPCAARRVEAKRGGMVMFTTLADRSGLIECVLFPDAYARFAPAMRAEIVRAEGRLDDTLGALTLVVERAEGFGAAASRDTHWGAWTDAGPGSAYRDERPLGPSEPHPGSRNRTPRAAPAA